MYVSLAGPFCSYLSWLGRFISRRPVFKLRRSRRFKCLSAVRAVFEPLEPRLLLSTDTLSGSSGDWSDNSNWSESRPPESGEDVVIDLAGGSDTLTYDPGTPVSINSLTLEGGPLTLTSGTLNIANGITINSGATLTVDAGATLTAEGVYQTNAGTIDIDGGTLTLNISGGGYITNRGIINISGGSLNMSSNELEVNNSGTINVSGGTFISGGGYGYQFINSSTGKINETGGTVSIGGYSGSGSTSFSFQNYGTITNSGSIEVSGGYAYFNNCIGLDGLGSYKTSFTNNAGGTIFVTGGQISIGGFSGYAGAGYVSGTWYNTFTNEGTIDATGGKISVSSYSTSGTVIANDGTITAGGGASVALNIQGNYAGGIVNSNTGTIDANGGNIALNATNASGSYITNSGTIEAFDAGNIQVNSNSGYNGFTSNYTLFTNYGTIDAAGGDIAIVVNSSSWDDAVNADFFNDNTITAAGGGYVDLSIQGSYAGYISNIGAISADGGDITLNATNASGSYVTNNETISAESGGIANIEILDSDDFRNYGTTTSASGGYVQSEIVSNYSSGLTVSGNQTLSPGTMWMIGGGLTLDNGVTLTIDAGAGITFVSGDSQSISLSGDGVGTILLDAASGHAAAQLNVGESDTLTIGSGITVNGTGSISGNLDMAGNLTIDPTANINIGGAISGAGNLTVGGTSGSSLTLTGANTYTGITTINSGAILQIGEGNTIGSLGSGSITDNGTLVFDLGTTASFSNAISGTGLVEQTGTGTTTLSGIIGSTAVAVSANAGTLILTNTNNYTGTTTINSGATLQIGNGGTMASSLGSGNVTDNGTLIFDRSSAQTVSNVISGTGAVQISGTGAITLTDANTYTGVMTINSGATLDVTGSIPWVVTDNGTLNVENSFCIANLSGSGNINLFNGDTLSVAPTGTDLFSGVIFGAGNLIVGGTPESNFALSSAALNQVQLMVDSGDTLTVENGLMFSNGASITVNAGGAIDFIHGASSSQTISGTGQIVLDAAGGSAAGQWTISGTSDSVTLGSDITVSGAGYINGSSTDTLINQGTLEADSGQTLTISGLAFTDEGTLQTTGNGLIDINDGIFGANTTWIDQNIGNTPASGIASYNSGTGTWTLSSDGSGIGSSSDQFNFAGHAWTGNGSLVVEISSQSSGAASGIMLRDSSAAGAYFASVVLNSSNQAVFQWRNSAGDGSQSVNVSGSGPLWVELARNGSNFMGYYSINGTTWTQIGAGATINFTNSTVLAGMMTAASTGTSSATAVLNNFRLISTAPEPITVLAQSYTLQHDSTLTITDPGQGVLAGDVDPYGRPLTAELMSGVRDGSLQLNANGTFVYTPTPGWIGTDSFSYEATDGTYTSQCVTVSLNVIDNPPTAPSLNFTLFAGHTLTVDASNGLLAAASDSNGDVLALVDPSQITAGDGTLEVNSDGSFVYTPGAGFQGSDAFNYTVTDGVASDNATGVVHITVLESVPVAQNQIYSVQVGSVLAIGAGDGLLSGSYDADGASLSTGANSYTTSTADGTATVNPDGSFTYTPNTGFIGADQFTYTLTDGSTRSNTADVVINVVGEPPQAENDYYATAPGTTLNVAANQGVLANDVNTVPGQAMEAQLVQGGGPVHGSLQFNSDGSFSYSPNTGFSGTDQFTYDDVVDGLVSNVATVSISVGGHAPQESTLYYTVVHDQTLAITNAAQGLLANVADPSGGALSLTLAQGPSHGSLNLNPNGTFTYQPTSHYIGDDSFTFTTSDSTANSAPITVEIQVTDAAPIAANYTFAVSENGSLNVSASGGLLSGDSAPDGGALTAVLAAQAGDGAVSLNSNGSFTYTPRANFSGVDSFTYSVTDGVLSTSGLVTIDVTAPSLPPAAQNTSYSAYENNPLDVTTGSLLAGVSDPQNLPMQVNLVSGPAHGTLTLNSNGEFDYSPAANFTGNDAFTYTISDSGGNTSGTLTAAITVNSDVPTVANGSINIAANGAAVIPASQGLLTLSSDPAGDPLTAQLVSGPSYGTLVLNQNGSYTYTPESGFSGTDGFSYNVSNGTNTSNTADVTINVINSQIITNPLTYQVLHDQTYTSPAQLGVLRDDWATDGGALNAILVSQPNSGTVTLESDGQFTYTPALHFTGQTSFTYEAQEGSISSAPVTVTLNVIDTAPVTQGASYSVLAGQTLQVSGAQGVLSVDYDPDGDSLTVTQWSNPNDGTLSLNADGSFDYTPAAGFIGSDHFTYTASDGVDSSTASVTINVTDSGPVGVNQNFQVLHGQALTGNVLTGAYDPNGAALTAAVENDPSDGTLDLNSNGAFTYTPNPGFVGSDGFTFKVSDGTASNIYTASIAVENILPLVNPRSYSIQAGGTHSAEDDVLAGVSDPAGDQLTAELYADGSVQSSGSYTTAAGTVNLNSSGNFTYTPSSGFVGAASFYFVVADGPGPADQTTPTAVTINVTDPQPLAVNEFFSTSGGTTASGSLLTENNSLNSSTNLSIVLPGGSSTETTANGGTVTLGGSGGFSYSARSGFTGMDSFIYAISDGILTSNMATVTIDVNKMPPQTVSGFFSGVLNQNITGDALSGDTDPSGGSLSVASVNGESLDGASQTVSIGGGNLTIGSGGGFTFTPGTGFSGQTSFSYVATDGDLFSAATTVTLSVQNVAVAAAPQTYSTTPGQPVSGNLLTGAAVIGNGSATLVSINNQLISSSGYVDLGSGGYVSADSNGSFTFTPDSTFVGQEQFSYTISDGGVQSNNTATINVTAQPPTAGALSFQGQENTPINIPFSSLIAAAQDPNSAAISFNYSDDIVVQPINGTISPNSAGTGLTYTPNYNFHGNDGFDYLVVDSLGMVSAPATVTLNVAQAGRTLTAGDINLATMENQPVSVDVLDYVDSSTAAPVNSQGITVAITSRPDYGTASVSGTTITYLPNNNSTQKDLLLYSLTTSGGQTSTGLIDITVSKAILPLNPNPTEQLTVNENSSGSIGIPGPITDTAGNSAGYALVDITGQPSDGFAYFSNGEFTYTPNQNYTGSDSFQYIMYNDAWQPSASSTVNVTIVGSDPPPAAPPQPQAKLYTQAPPNPTFLQGIEQNQAENNLGPTFTWVYPPQGATGPFNTSPDSASSGYYVDGNNLYHFSIGASSYSRSSYAGVSITFTANGASVSGYGAPIYSTTITDQTLNGATPNFTLTPNFDFAKGNGGYSGGYSLQLSSSGGIGNMSYSGNINVSAGSSYGSIGNISTGGNIFISESGDNIGNLVSTNGNINASAYVNIGNVSASAGYVSLYAGGDIGDVFAGSTNSSYYNSVSAGENISGVSSSGYIYRVQTKYGNIGNVSSLQNIGGVIAGSYYAGKLIGLANSGYDGNITGMVSAQGNIGAITAGGYISGSISSVDGNISSVTAGSYISGAISAGGYINSVTAGGYISNSISAYGGNIGSITAQTLNDAQISAEGNIGNIETYGDLDANISSSGSIRSVNSVGGSISGSITASTTIGAGSSSGAVYGIRAHDDITASVSASGSIQEIVAGRDLSGDISSSNGTIGSVQVGRNLLSSAAVSAQSLPSVAVGDAIYGSLTTTNGGYIGIVSAASLQGSINSGGNITSVSAGSYYDQQSGLSGFISNAGITAAGSIGSVDVYSIAGFTGNTGISNTAIKADGGGINSIESFMGSMSNVTITADGSIGSVTTGNGGYDNVFADISGSITATSGSIGVMGADDSLSGGISADVSMNASVSAGTFITKVYAGENIGGGITAQQFIGPVTALTGNITGAIQSKKSSITGVVSGGNISGAITAQTSIGSGNTYGVDADGSISGAITAVLGNISYITAGESVITGGNISGNIKAGGNIGNITAGPNFNVNESVDPTAGPDPIPPQTQSHQPQLAANGLPAAPTLAILPEPPISTLGAIGGSIKAGGSIGDITAGAGINGTISSGTTVGSIWALGNIAGTITVGQGQVNIDAWGILSANVTAKGGAISAAAYGTLSGNLTANAGYVNASSWNALTGNITADGDVSAWSAGALSSTITAGGSVAEISWTSISNSVAVNSSSSSGGSGGSGSNSEGSVAAQAIGDLTSSFSGKILNAVMDTWGTLSLSSTISLDGYFIGFSQGSLSVSGSINAVSGVTLVSAGSISGGGAITTAGNVGISALGSVSGVSVTAAPPESGGATTIDVSGSTVSGELTGTNVLVDVSGNDNADIYGVNAEVRAGGGVYGAIDVSGTADVEAGGSVTAPITAVRGAAITSQGSINSTVDSSQGAVVIQAQGGVSGSVIAYTYANIITWGQLSSSVTTGSGGGYISVFAADGVTGNIDAGGSASVQSWSNVSGDVTAGDGSTSGSEFSASISADGNVSGTVTSSGNVNISASQGVSSGITATAGYASVQAGGTFGGTVTAQGDVNILADSVSAGNITSQQGGVNVQSLVVISGATVSAATYASLFAGTTVQDGVTLTGSGGSVNVTALAGVPSLSVSAPGATVDVTSGGSASVAISDESGDGSYESGDAGTVTVDAGGAISGSAYAGGQISLFAAGSSGALNFSATSTGGGIQASSDSAMNADLTSDSASITASSMSTLAGTFTADAGTGGYVGLNAAGNISGAVVTAGQSASVNSGASISSGNVTSGGSAAISAAGAITGLTLTAADASSVVALNGGISGTIDTDTSGADSTDQFLASGAISATITSGGGVSVQTASGFSGTLHAAGNAVVDADGTLSGPITAGGYANVTAASVTAAITAGAGANVFSAGTVSAAVTASGGAATVNAGSTITGPVTGQSGVTVYAPGNISENLTSSQGGVTADSGAVISSDIQAHGNVNVSALGNITGSITASSGYATVATFGELSGAVDAANGANVSASGDIAAPIQSSAGSVTVNTLGNLAAAVSAADSANVTALSDVSGTVSAGLDAIVTSFDGNISGNVTASSGYADVSSPDQVSSTITAGGSAIVSSGADSSPIIDALFATLDAEGATQVQINSGAGGAVVNAMGGALAAEIDSQGSVNISSTGAVDAAINATGQINIAAEGVLTGFATSTGAGVSISGGGNVNMSIQAQSANAQVLVDTIGNLSGTIASGSGGGSYGSGGGGGVTVSVGGSATGVTITAAGGVNLSTGGSFAGSIDSTDGSVTELVGGSATMGNSSAGQSYTLAAMGNLTGNITAGTNANISAGGYINVSGTESGGGSYESGVITAGDSAYVTGVGEVSGTINAGQNITAASLGLIAAQMNAGQNLAVYSYGGIDASAAGTAGNDITELWSTSPIAGSFTADHNIDTVQGYSNISATLTAGDGSSESGDGSGVIDNITAWGNITGSITASAQVDSIVAGGTISAAPNTPEVVSHVEHAEGIYAYYPTMPTNVLAGAQAALTGLNTAISQAQTQIAQSQAAASAAIASEQALTAQTVSQIQASNALSQAAAQEAIAAQTYATNAAVTQANSYVLAQFAQSQAQSNAGLVDAKASDAQMDDSFVDSLVSSQLTLNTMGTNLVNGFATQHTAEQQEENINSQANSAAQSQLATDNSTSNRAQAWASQASSQFAAVSTSIAEDAGRTAGNVLNYGLLAVSVADPAFGVGRALLADSIYTLESNYFYEVPRLVIRLFPGESFSAATAMEGGESGLINTVDNINLQIGNVEDDEAINVAIDAGQGTGDETVLNYSLTDAVNAAENIEAVTGQLQLKLDFAFERFGQQGFTKAQQAALLTNPGLEAAFTGERIDTFFKESVQADLNLKQLLVTSRFQFGPDIYDSVNNVWYDVTTPDEWLAHLTKYTQGFGFGIPLFY
jgi:large repetitive protein